MRCQLWNARCTLVRCPQNTTGENTLPPLSVDRHFCSVVAASRLHTSFVKITIDHGTNSRMRTYHTTGSMSVSRYQSRGLHSLYYRWPRACTSAFVRKSRELRGADGGGRGTLLGPDIVGILDHLWFQIGAGKEGSTREQEVCCHTVVRNVTARTNTHCARCSAHRRGTASAR